MGGITQRQQQAILEKARAIFGGELGPQEALLVQMACDWAMSQCCRKDIPQEMEQAVAALAVSMTAGGTESGTVKSIQRGDTAVTYAVGSRSSGSDARRAADALAPWRRMGTVKEERL